MPKVTSKTLKQVAEIIGGVLNETACANEGLFIDSIAVSPATSESGDLVFVYDQKYLKNIQTVRAKAFILPHEVKDKLPQEFKMPVIWAQRPRLVMKKLLEAFGGTKYSLKSGIHLSAVIDSSSKIAKNAAIDANVFIGPDSSVGENTKIYPNVFIGSNVSIGNNCIIYPNCSLMDRVKIGNNVIIHSGTVIGSDGYSYVTEEESNFEKAKRGDLNFNLGRQVQHKIPSAGGVVIEDDVEIGANSCVDSGTIGPTIIGAGTKIDNLVQIAHNCKIGRDCLIVGQVGFAGSVVTGDRIVAGGQVGFADNINVGNDVIFTAKSGIHGNITSNSIYVGMPAVPYQEHFKNEKAMRRLPRKFEKMEEQVKTLEEKINELESKLRIGV